MAFKCGLVSVYRRGRVGLVRERGVCEYAFV